MVWSGGGRKHIFMYLLCFLVSATFFEFLRFCLCFFVAFFVCFFGFGKICVVVLFVCVFCCVLVRRVL